MSNVEQQQDSTLDEASSIQSQTDNAGAIKVAGTHKQIPTVVRKSSKTSKPKPKSASVNRVEDLDSSSKCVSLSCVSTNQQSSPTIGKSKHKTNQQIQDNISHGLKHIPGKQPHPAISITEQHSKEKRKRSDSSNSKSTQNETFLVKRMTNSPKASFSSNEISASTEDAQNINNPTVQETSENKSSVETTLRKSSSFASDDNDSSLPQEAHLKDTHEIEKCAIVALQEAQELNTSEQIGIIKPKAIQKHRQPSAGLGTGNTESCSNERCISSDLTRRNSTPATLAKENPPTARRSLSFSMDSGTPGRGTPGRSTPGRSTPGRSTPGRARGLAERANSIPGPDSPTKRSDENSSSLDSLRNLNLELRDQVAKMRHQLESQKGNIKQAHWQKVLDLRQLRQQEHERLTLALTEQQEKLDKEKTKELEHLRDQLTVKAESDLQKLTRHKDAEITKLKMEVSCKDVMVQRLLGENRHAQLKLNIDVRKCKLLDDLKELRREKKELEETLSSAAVAGRTFSNDLRRHSQTFELEIAKVKREAQLEIKQLVS